MTDTAIFDMDGTLVDTVLMTAQALRELTGRHGLQVPPAEAVRDAMGLHDPAFVQSGCLILGIFSISECGDSRVICGICR